MTGHFTSYKTRPNHELATDMVRHLDGRPLQPYSTVSAGGNLVLPALPAGTLTASA